LRANLPGAATVETVSVFRQFGDANDGIARTARAFPRNALTPCFTHFRTENRFALFLEIL
jgi:hypothetical protein